MIGLMQTEVAQMMYMDKDSPFSGLAWGNAWSTEESRPFNIAAWYLKRFEMGERETSYLGTEERVMADLCAANYTTFMSWLSYSCGKQIGGE